MLFVKVALLGATLASCSTFFSTAIPAINNSTLPGTSQASSATNTSNPASQTPGSTAACTSIEGKAMQTCFQWPQSGQPHPTAPATSSTSQNATTSTSTSAHSQTSSPPAAMSPTNTTPSPSSSPNPTPESSTPAAPSTPIPASTSAPQCPASHLSHRSSSSLAIPIPISDNPNNTTLPASPPSFPLPSAPMPVSECTWIIGAPLNSCFPWPKPTSRARAVEMGLETSRVVARGAWPMTTFLTRVRGREGEGL